MYPSRYIFYLCVLLQLTCGAAITAQTTFQNTSAIIFPDVQPSPEAANPYPSSIEVAGMSGLISGLRITLHGFQHDFPDAVDIMLEAPNGVNLVILSDVGAAVDVSGINIVIDDSATAYLPDNSRITSGSFKPTNIGNDDLWPANTPAASTNTSLSAFHGFGPNGTWKLYASNDVAGGIGSIAGGWSITLYTGNEVVLGPRISSFTATYEETQRAIQLEWVFDHDSNERAFHIEHSTDQRKWKLIGVVNSANSINDRKTFRYQHKQSIHQNNYYRLSIPSVGAYYSSNIIVAEVREGKTNWKLYPNPASSYVLLTSESMLPSRADVRLVDIAGTVVDQRSLIVGGGTPARYALHYRAGIYFLHINCNGMTTTKQLVVKR